MDRLGSPVLAVGAFGLLGGDWFDWEDDLTAAAREALEGASLADVDRDLAAPPEIDGLHEVATSADDEPIYVPKVEVDLAADAERDAAYRVAAPIVRALHTALGDEHVRQYDVVFAVGESAWYEFADQRRVSVTSDLAERLDREPSFDAAALRDAVADADDGDPEIPPVDWGEPLDNQYYHGSSDWSGPVAFLGM